MSMIRDFFRGRMPLVFVFVIIYFFFEHADLDFTARVSMFFYHVNPLHLYDEASKFSFAMGSGHINYMPSTYILFAIWSLPLKILGTFGDPDQVMGLQIFWYKLLPTLVYFACLFPLKKIIYEFVKDETISEKVACLWLVCPFAFFSQFIFGQYDVFTIFCVLWGTVFYLKKDLNRFSILFGIGITFKYFPAFVFFPMLFAAEKDLRVIVKHSIFVALPVLLMTAPYLAVNSFEFKAGVMGFGAANRVFDMNVSNGTTSFNFIVFLWSLLCAYVYFFEENAEEWREVGLKYAALAITILFMLVEWHPQWLLFLTPFMIFNFMYRKNFRKYFVFQIIFNVIGIAACTQLFGFNIDQNLMRGGLLGLAYPEVWYNVLVPRVGNLFIPHDSKVWLAFFNAMLVIGSILTFKSLKSGGERVTIADFKSNVGLINAYIWSSVLVFPILCVGAYIMLVVRWRMIH